MSPRVLVVAIGLVSLLLFGASVNEAAAPIGGEEPTQVVPVVLSSLPPIRSLAALPTVTPDQETMVGREAAPRRLRGSRTACPGSTAESNVVADRDPAAGTRGDSRGL